MVAVVLLAVVFLLVFRMIRFTNERFNTWHKVVDREMETHILLQSIKKDINKRSFSFKTDSVLFFLGDSINNIKTNIHKHNRDNVNDNRIDSIGLKLTLYNYKLDSTYLVQLDTLNRWIDNTQPLFRSNTFLRDLSVDVYLKKLDPVTLYFPNLSSPMRPLYIMKHLQLE